jgi:hypothetical protein
MFSERTSAQEKSHLMGSRTKKMLGRRRMKRTVDREGREIALVQAMRVIARRIVAFDAR